MNDKRPDRALHHRKKGAIIAQIFLTERAAHDYHFHRRAHSCPFISLSLKPHYAVKFTQAHCWTTVKPDAICFY